MYESIIAVIIALIFAIMYLFENDKERIILKDAWLTLTIVFVLIALYSNTNLSQVVSVTYPVNNTVISNYTYTQSHALDPTGNGYGLVLVAIFIIILFNTLKDLWDKFRGK